MQLLDVLHRIVDLLPHPSEQSALDLHTDVEACREDLVNLVDDVKTLGERVLHGQAPADTGDGQAPADTAPPATVTSTDTQTGVTGS